MNRDPSRYNGGSAIALKGKDSVCVVSDMRIGESSIIASKSFTHVEVINEKTIVVGIGFAPDVQDLMNVLAPICSKFKITKGREINCKEAAHYVSSNIRSKRNIGGVYADFIIAGIYNGEPLVCDIDASGNIEANLEVSASGSSLRSLHCASSVLYEPGLDAETLLRVGAQIFLGSINRDAMSGPGAEAFVIDREKCMRYVLETRSD